MNDNETKPDIYHHIDQPPFKMRVVHGVVEEVEETKETTARQEDDYSEKAQPKETKKEEVKVQSVLEPEMKPAKNEEQKTPTGTYPPTKKNKLPLFKYFLIFLIIVIFSGSIIFLINNQSFANTKEGNFVAQGPDSDGDTIPDSLENAVGLNPSISEFDRCVGDVACVATSSASSKNVDMQFLVSLSASMNLSIDGQTKIDLVKGFIQNLLVEGINNPSVNYGLSVFGNEGTSSSADKNISCKSTETLAEIGELTNQNSVEYLSSLKPAGWSALGAGIELSGNNFSQEETNRKVLVIFADKQDECGNLLERKIGELLEQETEIYLIAIDPGESDLEYFLKIEKDLGVRVYSPAGTTEVNNTTSELSGNIFPKTSCDENFVKEAEQCFFETKRILSSFSSNNQIDKESVLSIVNEFSKKMENSLNEFVGKYSVD